MLLKPLTQDELGELHSNFDTCIQEAPLALKIFAYQVALGLVHRKKETPSSSEEKLSPTLCSTLCTIYPTPEYHRSVGRLASAVKIVIANECWPPIAWSPALP